MKVVKHGQTPLKHTMERVKFSEHDIGTEVVWIYDPRSDSEITEIGFLKKYEDGYRVETKDGRRLKVDSDRVEIYPR